MEDLRTMQAWSLKRKIQVTQTRIIEWYQHFEGKVYVSFSGGKDSTVLLDLARRIYPDIEAVFVDTGLEYPEIREFVKSFENVTWLRPKTPFPEVIKQQGYPIVSKEQSQYIREIRTTKSDKLRNLRLNGNDKGSFKISEKWKFLIDAPFDISEKCCDVMKKRPFHIYERETGSKPIVGIMASESTLRLNKWVREGCNAFDTKKPKSSPLSFWTEQDILQYIKQFDTPYANKVYGEIVEGEDGSLSLTGASRTGCMFCMFGVHLENEPNRFQRMAETHPKQYDYCIKPIEDGGLGLGKVLDYINVPYE